jgi:deoxyhypusine synthase
VDPDSLPDCVVAYVDTTVALPLLTAYCLTRFKVRKAKRLYDRRDQIIQRVTDAYLKTGTVSKIKPGRKLAKRSSSVGVAK